MGCTSSAPNMVGSLENATDVSTNFGEKTNEGPVKEATKNLDIENGRNGIKVLPMCDNLDDPIHVASSVKSDLIVSSSSVESETGLPNREDSTENNNFNDIEHLQIDEKLSTLEKVVEKVVELYVTDNIIDNSRNIANTDIEICDNKDNNVINISDDQEIIDSTEHEPAKEIEEQPEITISPTQSQSSRATRWEALADIAAELPPSLAVDPVTGQIYSLSK